MVSLMLLLLPVLLAVYALVDLVNTPTAQIQGLPRAMWVAVILLAWFVGPICWLVAGREKAGMKARFPALHRPAAFTRPRLAPDDDDAFLRGITYLPPPATPSTPSTSSTSTPPSAPSTPVAQPDEDEPPAAAAV